MGLSFCGVVDTVPHNTVYNNGPILHFPSFCRGVLQVGGEFGPALKKSGRKGEDLGKKSKIKQNGQKLNSPLTVRYGEWDERLRQEVE